jgi:hypothetical protein
MEALAIAHAVDERRAATARARLIRHGHILAIGPESLAALFFFRTRA